MFLVADCAGACVYLLGSLVFGCCVSRFSVRVVALSLSLYRLPVEFCILSCWFGLLRTALWRCVRWHNLCGLGLVYWLGLVSGSMFPWFVQGSLFPFTCLYMLIYPDLLVSSFVLLLIYTIVIFDQKKINTIYNISNNFAISSIWVQPFNFSLSH